MPIGRCIADEVGLVFEDVPATVRVVVPTGADLVAARHVRHAVVLTPDDTTLIYMVPTLSDIAVMKRNLPESPDIGARLRITTPRCLAAFLLANHERFLADRAVQMVETASAEHSARIVTTGSQGVVIGLLVSSALFTVILNPEWCWPVAHAVFSLGFFGCVLLRLLACKDVANARRRMLRPSTVAELPIYSVMIALYEEADVVSQLACAMTRLNWPSSKLEVLFLCEVDDTGTIAALESESLPSGFRVVPVPAIGPRTKPKALNYGLQIAKGEYVVVYDAEDRPHPDQLLEAWQRFSASEQRLGCLQAPLIIANAHEGWLTRLFAFEYAVHFGGILPWLACRGFVLPLGGSSNHFRRDCLEVVGGWDPYNVTEDAELGMRFARYGFRVDMLSMPTFEDAPTETTIWLRQRTRWLKGWMQTWLIEMRQPALILKQLGVQRFATYHLLTTGSIASALLYPFMLAFIAYAVCRFAFAEPAIVLSSVPVIDLLNILMGYMSFYILGMRVLRSQKMSGPVLVCIPFYWLMISVAAWRALWQLYKAPFLWEKTPHRPSQAYMRLRAR